SLRGRPRELGPPLRSLVGVAPWSLVAHRSSLTTRTPSRTRPAASLARRGRSVVIGRSPAPWSSRRHRRDLGLDGLQPLVPGGGELLHAFLFDDAHHVVVADAEPLQLLEHLPGLLVGAA